MGICSSLKKKKRELEMKEKDVEERENKLNSLNVDFAKTHVVDNRYIVQTFKGHYDTKNNTYKGESKRFEWNLKNNKIILPETSYLNNRGSNQKYYLEWDQIMSIRLK